MPESTRRSPPGPHPLGVSTAASCKARVEPEPKRCSAASAGRGLAPGDEGSAMTETAIADHGIIGDLQTAALVTTDGTIDWFCCPRFDSPSVFGALLDREKGGHFTVAPAHKTYATKQLYFPDTAVLVTRFMTEAGAGEVVDFMPVTGRTSTPRHRLVRMLRCVRGS